MTIEDDDLDTIPGMIIADLPDEELKTINEGIQRFHDWVLNLPRSAWTPRFYTASEKVKNLILAGFVHPSFFEDRLFLAAQRTGDLMGQVSALRSQALAARKAFHEKHPDIEAPYIDIRMSADELEKGFGNAK